MIITHTCNKCNTTYKGTVEELKEIFVNGSRLKYGITCTCKKCKNEFYHTKKMLHGEGSRVSVEELIEVLEEEGYPTTFKKLDEFLEESYIKCDISKSEWLDWISKSFYRHKKIKEILNGQIKRCSTCLKYKPKSSFYTQKGSSDGVRSFCSKCEIEYNRTWRNNNREKYRERRRVGYQKNKQRELEDRKKYAKENKTTVNRVKLRYYYRKKITEMGYKTPTKEQIDKLLSFKEEFNIKYIKDLVEKYGSAVCLKKI